MIICAKRIGRLFFHNDMFLDAPFKVTMRKQLSIHSAGKYGDENNHGFMSVYRIIRMSDQATCLSRPSHTVAVISSDDPCPIAGNRTSDPRTSPHKQHFLLYHPSQFAPRTFAPPPPRLPRPRKLHNYQAKPQCRTKISSRLDARVCSSSSSKVGAAAEAAAKAQSKIRESKYTAKHRDPDT